jgi:phosphoesterase RecJ-like protein
MDTREHILDHASDAQLAAAHAETVQVLRSLEGPIVVIGHLRPDGDAVGAVQAMRLMLADMGHEVYGYMRDVPSYLEFAAEGLVDKLPKGAKSVVAVDCASKGSRTPITDEALAGYFVINIDHHRSNTFEADYKLVVSSASSACEIIHDLRTAFGRTWKSDDAERAFADAVYLGLCTDTGNFAFALTTPHTMRVAAMCMEVGANVESIRSQLAKRTMAETELLKLALNNTQFLYLDAPGGNAQVALVLLEKDQIPPGDTPNMQPILTMLRSIEHVQVAISCTATPEGPYRVSLRSNPPVNVREVAEKWNGGGHDQAAGARLNDSRGELQALAEDVYRVIEASKA